MINCEALKLPSSTLKLTMEGGKSFVIQLLCATCTLTSLTMVGKNSILNESIEIWHWSLKNSPKKKNLINSQPLYDYKAISGDYLSRTWVGLVLDRSGKCQMC